VTSSKVNIRLLLRLFHDEELISFFSHYFFCHQLHSGRAESNLNCATTRFESLFLIYVILSNCLTNQLELLMNFALLSFVNAISVIYFDRRRLYDLPVHPHKPQSCRAAELSVPSASLWLGIKPFE